MKNYVAEQRVNNIGMISDKYPSIKVVKVKEFVLSFHVALLRNVSSANPPGVWYLRAARKTHKSRSTSFITFIIQCSALSRTHPLNSHILHNFPLKNQIHF